MAAGQFLAGGQPLRYAIFFENLETASAAAQEVVITDQLDGNKVDFDSFSLGPISFGDHRVTPPPGLSQFSTSVDLRPTLDLIAAIDARLDKSTGVITWRFTSIDPLTGQFTEDPLAGFLPPNVSPPEGDGAVLFTVQPKVTDTLICNQASIVFDVNAPILTPEWCNTIDATPPQSRVLPLALVQTDTTFVVQWEGTDAGAGVGDFTIYVSENGGTFVPLLIDTPETSTMFTGQAGATYAFCSRSRDLVGTTEMKACPPDADTASTIVLAGVPLDLGTGVGQPGAIACVPATLTAAPAPVAATTNDVGFDPSQFAVNSCTINPAIGAGSSANKGLTVTTLSPGAERVQIGGNANLIPDGVVYTCEFGVGASASVGAHPLTNTANGAAGQIIITTCTGDCNGDGTVSIGEVIKCVNLFLGQPFCNLSNPSLSCPVADATPNGVVSIGDVIQCVNRFLNGC